MRVRSIKNRKVYGIKLVYVGTPESGKTTNVFEIAKQWAMKTSSVDTKGERTLFFDFTSKKTFLKGPIVIQISTYSVPGQKHYRPMREIILKGADILVFVADSGLDKLQENIDSYNDIEDIMFNTYQKSPRNLSMVFQWNKRDLPQKTPVNTLSYTINKYHFPEIESIANKAEGVIETFLVAINKFLIQHNIDATLTLADMGFVPQQQQSYMLGRRNY